MCLVVFMTQANGKFERAIKYKKDKKLNNFDNF